MAWLLLCPPSNVRFFFPVNVSSTFSWEFLMVPHRSSPTGLPRMCDICHVLLPQFGLVVICSLRAGGGHLCLCPCHITTIEPVSWPRVFPLRSPKWTRGTMCITLMWYKSPSPVCPPFVIVCLKICCLFHRVWSEIWCWGNWLHPWRKIKVDSYFPSY